MATWRQRFNGLIHIFKSAKKCVANMQTKRALKYVVTIVDLLIYTLYLLLKNAYKLEQFVTVLFCSCEKESYLY